MDRLIEEAKNDAAGEIGANGETGGGKNSESESEDEELGDLPPDVELLVGGGRVYKSEDELQEALVAAGVGDLPAVLVDGGKPRLVMPSDQHNRFTSVYVAHFNKKWGDWGFCTGTHKIHLANGKSRDPDIGYWGYPRCRRIPGDIVAPADGGSIPDVLIQFSWQNRKTYEVEAINDMMNQGLEKDHGPLSTTRPRLGYLIKVRFSKKRRLPGAVKGSKTQDPEGLDIYRLPHGTTIADALDATNQEAKHWHYVPGGPDVFITIAPQDLGITGFWSVLCGVYRIKASELFQAMHQYHIDRQSDGLAT